MNRLEEIRESLEFYIQEIEFFESLFNRFFVYIFSENTLPNSEKMAAELKRFEESFKTIKSNYDKLSTKSTGVFEEQEIIALEKAFRNIEQEYLSEKKQFYSYFKHYLHIDKTH